MLFCRNRMNLQRILMVGLAPFLATSVMAEGNAHAEDESAGMLEVGLMAGVAPRYMGSDDYSAMVVPVLSYRRGGFFIGGLGGIGYAHQGESGFQVRAALNYDPGRVDNKDTDGYWAPRGSRDLDGMGRIRGSTVLQLGLSQPVAPWMMLDAEADIRLTGQRKRGNRYGLGFTVLPYQRDDAQLSIGLRADIGDGNYNQTYFGVNDQQSARSGHPVFRAERGLQSWTMTMQWSMQLATNWSFLALAEGTRFSGKIRKSTIVRDDVNGVVAAGIQYQF